jgi:NADPH2:quinone reductase
MRAAIYRSLGRAEDVLQVVELPDPQPGPGDVLVRLSYSGVNPTDWRARSGNSQVPLAFDHQVPGQDGAGVIEAVGPGVPQDRVGSRVWVYHAAANRPGGTAAQKVVVPQRQAIDLPDHVDLELGACLGIPYVTAALALLSHGGMKGATVLVHGGGGAVGSASIQLAKHLGAQVITTVSGPDKAEVATASGADHVINYKAVDAAEEVARVAPDGVDLVIEVALTSNLELDLKVLRTGGTVLTYARETEEVTIPVLPLMRKNVRLAFTLVYQASDGELQDAVRVVEDLLAHGQPVAPPRHVYDLDRIVDAHHAVEAGTFGRILLRTD